MRAAREPLDGELVQERPAGKPAAPVSLAGVGIDALQAGISNQQIARMILARQGPALQDPAPRKLPGLGAPAGDRPDWLTAVNQDPLPGDLVPGYVEWRMS